jgi:hypothetical protein
LSFNSQPICSGSVKTDRTGSGLPGQATLLTLGGGLKTKRCHRKSKAAVQTFNAKIMALPACHGKTTIRQSIFIQRLDDMSGWASRRVLTTIAAVLMTVAIGLGFGWLHTNWFQYPP